ncbi:LuxR C-terminal-related transcriptional regulator [Chitinophaga caseinilytica]|jgi:DNA-binding CsgD family transcriptional regulator|uniref:LuxR C-terminal-related transcriptional regulator n=1 Tax=Chitinophaga caseinilytica TaxID=2267521 RepID=A0ABZ2Z5B5_9BACT
MSSKSDLYLEVKKYWTNVAGKEGHVDFRSLQLQIETHKRLFNIFQAGNYFFLLVDIYNGEIAEVGPGLMDVLGYGQGELTMEEYVNGIHPQDMPYFLKFEQHITNFYNELAVDLICQYKMQYDLRIKKKDGNYARMLIQYIIVNHQGHDLKHSFHLHTDITHIKGEGEGEPHLSLIGMNGLPCYYDIQKSMSCTSSKSLFTAREKEILKGIVEGKSSRQLAGELFVSIHTINSHRKNILAKSNVKTPLELVKKSIMEGWT